MTAAGKSIFYFGFWVLACGIGLMILPEFSLSMVNMQLNSYITVRLFGMVLVYLAIYYFVLAKRKESWPFFRVSVFTRGSALLLVTLFVIIGWAKPIIIGFVVVDALGALWTFFALKKDKKAGLLQ